MALNNGRPRTVQKCEDCGAAFYVGVYIKIAKGMGWDVCPTAPLPDGGIYGQTT